MYSVEGFCGTKGEGDEFRRPSNLSLGARVQSTGYVARHCDRISHVFQCWVYRSSLCQRERVVHCGGGSATCRRRQAGPGERVGGGIDDSVGWRRRSRRHTNRGPVEREHLIRGSRASANGWAKVGRDRMTRSNIGGLRMGRMRGWGRA